jgi:DNA replication and repair protein RecF
MLLKELNILNYKNIREASLHFSDKINAFVGLNGQGKTNILDAIYYLSFTKSAYNAIDSQNIHHDEDMAMIQGKYYSSDNEEIISCGIKRGVKKQFRRGKKDYKRLIDHIGLIPLVMVSPQDSELVVEGSDERRKFMDGVISQYSKSYLEHLTQYNILLKQRNALLKQYAEQPEQLPDTLMEVLEQQMVSHAMPIYQARVQFIEQFVPYFQQVYSAISNDKELVSLVYQSQLHERDLLESLARTRSRDLILGWTSQGIHKDELEMMLGDYPLKRVGSQGQQKSYLLAMKLGQALYLNAEQILNTQPILLLDDIFDKLDSERVERIIQLVGDERFGQIFITDTDRQHLTKILSQEHFDAKLFQVENGEVNTLNNIQN